ncbi:hypothetical protein BJX66DRAFT_306407 [Aspergillus keveii]|uniref:Uncharacterized protein n=1 Tax=Aspergillus keveii TaxID=714993 RepID=A0ABR4G2M4_9EURO
MLRFHPFSAGVSMQDSKLLTEYLFPLSCERAIHGVGPEETARMRRHRFRRDWVRRLDVGCPGQRFLCSRKAFPDGNRLPVPRPAALLALCAQVMLRKYEIRYQGLASFTKKSCSC